MDDKVANAAEAHAEIEKQAVKLNTLLDTSRSAEVSALEKVEKLSQKLKLSESEKPKFEIVIGNNKRAEANIAGITPAVLIFKGKWEDSPP